MEAGYSLKLYIAGSLKYDPSYSRRFIKSIERSSYSSNIILLNEITDSQSFYEYIDILSVPSIYNEPSSNVIAEAKLYHKPSIIFKSGGMPELVTHLKDGYICDSTSEESLKEGILFYLQNIDSHIEHGENAFNSMKRIGIDYEVFEQKWLNIFK